jgi:hypothetical protein
MRGRRRWLWLAISVSLLSQGCTHHVGPERPSTLWYAEKSRVLAAGPFAQESAIRQSTHVVYENIFKSLVADIRAGYRGWTQ